MITAWEPHNDDNSKGQTYYYNDSYRETEWNPVDFIQKEESEVKDDIAYPIDITTFDYHRLSDSGIYYNGANGGKYVHYPTYKFELKGRFEVKSGNPDTIHIEFDKNKASSFITNSDGTKIIFTDNDEATDENLNRIFKNIMKTVAEDTKYEFKIKGLAVRNCGIVKLDILNVSSKTNGGNIYLYKLEIVNKKKILPEFIDDIIKANNKCRNENEKEKDEAEKQRVVAEEEAERKRVAAEEEAERKRVAAEESERQRVAAEKEAETQRLEKKAAEEEAERQRLEEAEAERQRVAAEEAKIKNIENAWVVQYDKEDYHRLYWANKITKKSSFDPPDETFITEDEKEASKWSWLIVSNKVVWFYDNIQAAKSPPKLEEVKQNIKTTLAQTQQIQAAADAQEKINKAAAAAATAAAERDAAAERERQATLKAASDAAAAAERERLKTLETERLKKNELAEKNSWKTIYTPDNAIKWQKNNETATFTPPESATFEELVASKWKWTKITENGKVKIKWNNTVDPKKGKRPDDIITDVVGQFPTIHDSPITKQAQTQQRAAAESALKAQSVVPATQDDPDYGKTLYKEWLNRHDETEQSIINRRAKIQSDNIYYFKTYIEKIKSQDDFYAVINEIKKARYLENRTIKNRETFVSNASMQNAARIGEYFDHLLKKDVKNPAVSTILGLNQGGSSKTMKNNMKINKKTRKNVRDYATKGGTFTTKTIRSKKSKFRHTRKHKAR